jgi:translation initiation factor IF-2
MSRSQLSFTGFCSPQNPRNLKVFSTLCVKRHYNQPKANGEGSGDCLCVTQKWHDSSLQVVEVSAVKRIGLEKLEEALLLQAELMELRACSSDEPHAVVVEARVDRGQGPLATVIVRSGTIVPGMNIVMGTQWGRIRALRDMLGCQIVSAGPSTPVEIDGLRGLPEAGDEIQVVISEERARKLSQARYSRTEERRHWELKQRNMAATVTAVAEDGTEEPKSEKVEMAVVVKADVQGTAQAVSQALASLSCPQVTHMDSF